MNSASGGRIFALEYPSTSALGAGEWASAPKGQRAWGNASTGRAGRFDRSRSDSAESSILAVSAGIVSASPAFAAAPSAPALTSVTPGPTIGNMTLQLDTRHSSTAALRSRRINTESRSTAACSHCPVTLPGGGTGRSAIRVVPRAGRKRSRLRIPSARAQPCRELVERHGWHEVGHSECPATRPGRRGARRRSGNAAMAALEIERRPRRQLPVQRQCGGNGLRAEPDNDPRRIDHTRDRVAVAGPFRAPALPDRHPAG